MKNLRQQYLLGGFPNLHLTFINVTGADGIAILILINHLTGKVEAIKSGKGGIKQDATKKEFRNVALNAVLNNNSVADLSIEYTKQGTPSLVLLSKGLFTTKAALDFSIRYNVSFMRFSWKIDGLPLIVKDVGMLLNSKDTYETFDKSLLLVQDVVAKTLRKLRKQDENSLALPIVSE
uniref:Uncharacterized protein n=1 Tax=Microbotryum lychnidis-dioicae TaxID=288795 RepID=M1GLC8_9BASI|nr:hypothetical protein H911_mgp20 [Microbotryum lychnidis-dioicae]AGE14598.1 hypothetical protein [Microbotryum lychnidis-dioicae]